MTVAPCDRAAWLRPTLNGLKDLEPGRLPSIWPLLSEGRSCNPNAVFADREERDENALLTGGLVSHNLPLVATDRERDVWAALGDGTRRAIVLMLAAGPMSVGDLAARLPVTRPAVSQHLKLLKDAGVVSETAV